MGNLATFQLFFFSFRLAFQPEKHPNCHLASRMNKILCPVQYFAENIKILHEAGHPVHCAEILPTERSDEK